MGIHLNIEKLFWEDPNAMQYVAQGVEYKRRGALQQAKQCYAEALRVRQDCQAAHFALGKLFYLMNEYEDSWAEYQVAIYYIVKRTLYELRSQGVSENSDFAALAQEFVKSKWSIHIR